MENSKIYFYKISVNNERFDLFLDKVFFMFENEPLLFTCKDRKGRNYFCHCYNMLDIQKWFIIPITDDELHNIIGKKIGLRDLFFSKKKVIHYSMDVNGNENRQWIPVNKIPKENVPKMNLFIK